MSDQSPRDFSFSRYENSSRQVALVRDDELDDAQRNYLSEFTVPRHALDGSIVWLLEEVEGCD